MENQLKNLTGLMKLYAERHNIKIGILLILEDDETGEIQTSLYDEIFSFNSISELIEKLKQ